MNILVVYCHSSKNSFTHTVKESFVKGLEDAGYSYEISDLYEENFCPVMSEDEYVREGFYRMDRPVKEDVLREQEKINRAKKCEVYVFDEMTRGYGNDENREKRAILFSNRAYDLAQNIENNLAPRTPEAKADGI